MFVVLGLCVILTMASESVSASSDSNIAQPHLNDNNLGIELVTDGISHPTSMAFIDSTNILVLEKNTGAVRLITDGFLKEDPVIKLDVDIGSSETCCRGLLGVATRPISQNTITDIDTNIDGTLSEVFLYLSEISSTDEVRNRVYKYTWNGEKLVNPELLLDLPAEPGPNHPGGKLEFGTDGYLYTVIGDLNNEGQLQNTNDGSVLTDSSVILRINATDGSAAAGNPFANPFKDTGREEPLGLSDSGNQMEKYFAYGIRNSFGLSVDPYTGYIWDTENGDKDFDEINIIGPGFNSGWKKLMGPISRSDVTQEDLVMFQGSYYGDPVFSWNPSIGVTDIEFFNSNSLGRLYAGNIFVGDIANGNLYFYDVNAARNGIIPRDAGLSDLVADGDEELSVNLLGTGFLGITDIETGPDGFLYILTFDYEGDGEGRVYRIIPRNTA